MFKIDDYSEKIEKIGIAALNFNLDTRVINEKSHYERRGSDSKYS